MDITKLTKGMTKWNRKIHLYLGLCLLFFIMIIGFSGLLLNHHWEFASFWKERNETSYTKTIQLAGEKGQEALVKEILIKSELKGSVNNVEFSADSLFLNFNVSKPGTNYNIQANLPEASR